MTDHIAEAKKIIERPGYGPSATSVAQVHAILALTEQVKRIADYMTAPKFYDVSDL